MAALLIFVGALVVIVGGAIVPYVMGRVADAEGMGTAFLIPLACFVVVVVYAWKVGHLRASAT